MLGSCVLLYSRLSLRFSLMKSRMAWLIGDLESLRLYTLGVDVSTAFMSLSHKVTASSSSSICVVMFVSILVRLSFSVLCRCTFQILGGWQGRRALHVPPSLPPPLIFKAKLKIFVTLPS